ncbi:MAG: InlB B-repeat-containing protein, partial [Bacteroidales bacterium]|nr:InlB B-repeat-containing protein [Candidatus Colicola caccequi]
MKNKIRFLAMMLIGVLLSVNQVWGADIIIDIDFTSSEDIPSDFPTASSDNVTSGTYTFGDYDFSFSCKTAVYYGTPDNGKTHCLFIGKCGATEDNASVITFPAIANYKLSEVTLTATAGGSQNVGMSIRSDWNNIVTGGSSWTYVQSDSKTWTLTGTEDNTSYKLYISRVLGSNTYNSQIASLQLTYTSSTPPVTYTDYLTDCAAPVSPEITTQPADQNYMLGAEPTAMSVEATISSGGLTYQWQSSTDDGTNWSDIVGATSSTYTIPSTNTPGCAKYRCIVGNSAGGDPVTSNAATVTITGWYLYSNFGDGTNWTDAQMSWQNDIASIQVNLPKEVNRSFKIKLKQCGDRYYGAQNESNNITQTTSVFGWQLTTDKTGYDVNITTAARGNYTIRVRTNDAKMDVTYPTAYTITFHSGGADGGTAVSPVGNLAIGDDVVLPANTWTKTNSVFAGWATEEHGAVVYAGQGTVTNLQGNMNLYAVWSATRYTVTFDAAEGQVSPNMATQAITGGSVALPTPTREGYEFTGWYNGAQKIDGIYYIPTADVTLTAHWADLAIDWYLKGSFDGWGTGIRFQKKPGETGNIAYATIYLTSNIDEFKLYNSTYVYYKGYYQGNITRDNCTNWKLNHNNSGDNVKLTIDGAGYYVFKLNYSESEPVISVFYPGWKISVFNSSAGTTGDHQFTFVSSQDWKLENFVVPTYGGSGDKQLWVGPNKWVAEHSENWWPRWIKLYQYASETIGHGVEGAVGTLHINPESGDKNYGLRFDPAGYGM